MGGLPAPPGRPPSHGAAGFWPAQTVANHALAGEAALDTATAMTALPLLGGAGWDEALCREIGVRPEQLPRLVAGWEAAADIDGVPLGAGIPDGLAELALWPAPPTRATSSSRSAAHCSAGSSATAGRRSTVSGPSPTSCPTAAWSAAPATPAGCSGTACAPCSATRPPGEDFDAALADLDPGDLPLWLPSIHPERTPVAGSAPTASLLGLEATHGRAHLHRSALESAGFVVRRHIHVAGITPRRIVATGGGTAVGPWMQALADCTGLPVHVGAVPESAALGAAFAARLVAGLETDLADGARWAATSRIVEPDPRWTGPTEARYHRFETLMAPAATAASDRAAYERSPERPDDSWDDAEAWLSP